MGIIGKKPTEYTVKELRDHLSTLVRGGYGASPVLYKERESMDGSVLLSINNLRIHGGIVIISKEENN